MTVQDWFTDLGDDEEPSATATPGRRRWLLAGALAAVLAVAAVVVVVTQRLVAAPPAATAATTPAPGVAAGTTAPAQEEAVVIRADLADPGVTGGLRLAPLVVGTQPLQGGAAPDRVPHFDTCGADVATLQYLPVEIRVPEYGLSATFAVKTTASTPAGIGRLGFFFQAGDAGMPCPGGAWSASDSFLASNAGQDRITGYVVLDQAFTPSAPQGRPDVFRTLRLRVSNIRSSGRLATVSAPTPGSLCPGTQDELCAPLG